MVWYIAGLMMIPYVFVGTETGNMMAAFMASIALLLHHKNIEKRSLRVTAFLAWVVLAGVFNMRAGMMVEGLPLWLAIGVGMILVDGEKPDDSEKDRMIRLYIYTVSAIALGNLILSIGLGVPMTGLVGYENAFALQIALAILFQLDRMKKKSRRIDMSSILVLPLVASLAMTGSKFTWVLLLAGLIQVFLSSKVTFPSKVITSSNAFILPLGMLSGTLLAVFFPQVAHSAGTILERIIVIRDIGVHWIQHPLSFFIGEGLGTFKNMQYGLQSVYYDIRHIHNGVVSVTFETGVIGLSLLLYAFLGRRLPKGINGIALGLMGAHMLFEFDMAYAWFACVAVVLLEPVEASVVEPEGRHVLIPAKHATNYMGIPLLVVTTILLVPMLMVQAGDVLRDDNPMGSLALYRQAAILAPWSESPSSSEFDLMMFMSMQAQSDAKPQIRRASEIVDGMVVRAEGLGLPDGRLYLNQAYLRGLDGDVDGAAKAYEVAISLMPFNPNGYEAYGRFIEQKGLEDPYRARVERTKGEALERLNPLASFLPKQIK